MTLLSRKADYALLILSYLHDRPGTARAIADKFGISRLVRREHPEGTLSVRLRLEPPRGEGRLRSCATREHDHARRTCSNRSRTAFA